MVSKPLPIAAVHPGGERRPKRLEQTHKPSTEDTFMNALLELPCEFTHRNPLEWTFSLLLHTAVIAALLIAPLYFSQAIDLKAFQTKWLVAPLPPGPPPPPAAPVVQHATKSVARLIQGGKMVVPSMIPKAIVIVKEEPLPIDTSGDGVVGGVPGGVPGGRSAEFSEASSEEERTGWLRLLLRLLR